jgi:hypothetical protein
MFALIDLARLAARNCFLASSRSLTCHRLAEEDIDSLGDDL